MALLNPYMVKSCLDSAQGSLKIQAETGKSLRIIGLRFGALASGGFAECLIDRKSVGFFYIGDINANHLEQWSLATALGNVFGRMIQLDLLKGFPVAEGETFEVKPRVAGSTVQGAIVYEEHEAGDMTPDMPNGSTSSEFLFLNYGTNSSTINAGEIGSLDKTRNPSEYPAFPFGDSVPPKYSATLHGILLMDWQDAAGNLNPNYAHLKLTKDREVLFDPERKGIYVREGMGFLTWGPCRQINVDIELFPAPVTFGPGDELNVQMEAGGADAIAGDDILLATIQTMTRLE